MIVYGVLPLASYLLGAVPFGFLIVRARKGIDLRTVGSGNLGATNASRILGPRWFFVVFALDLLKGFVPARTPIAEVQHGYQNTEHKDMFNDFHKCIPSY